MLLEKQAISRACAGTRRDKPEGANLRKPGPARSLLWKKTPAREDTSMSRHDPEATRKQIRKIENEVMRKMPAGRE